MKILFLEPFFGGSHKEFALGLQNHSSHGIELLTFPPIFWKWRMRGAALQFHEALPYGLGEYDGIIATDMMNLAEFKGLAGSSMPPCLLYFHENQLTYPLNTGRKADYQFAFINIVSAAAADAVVFNSNTHLNAFFSHVPEVLAAIPDGPIPCLSEKIMKKAKVLYPGWSCYAGDMKASLFYDRQPPMNDRPPLIIWNHRWEYDKNPQLFFRVLYQLKEKGISFRLAVLGESLDVVPDIFKDAGKRLVDEIEVFGYVDSRDDYMEWLHRGDIIVSTAFQENFGISVVEAVGMGCFPLLPERLSYPEIIPEKYWNMVLYKNRKELLKKLEEVLTNSRAFDPLRASLSIYMEKFSWVKIKHDYDAELVSLCNRGLR